jgi:hypothetical protein
MIRFFRQGCFGTRIARRSSSLSARRAGTDGRPSAAHEPLERRAMLSADTAGLTRQIDWHGRGVEVHADSWIARTSATQAGQLGLAAGWQAE